MGIASTLPGDDPPKLTTLAANGGEGNETGDIDMGMDLLAVKPSAEARRFEKQGNWWGGGAAHGPGLPVLVIGSYTPPPDGPLRAQQEHCAGAVVPGRYTVFAWKRLLKALPGWGASTDGFPVDNRGHVISGRACRRVADALTSHLTEYAALIENLSAADFAALPAADQTALVEDAKFDIEGWRTCGGYAVW